MPVSLAKIASNTASVTFQVGEDTVTIVYYPSRVTERTFAQLQAFSRMNEATMGSTFGDFNEMLAKLIKSWDVYEDEEQQVMFPLDAERLSELPLVFRSEIMRAIMGDIRPEAFASQTRTRLTPNSLG